MCPFLELEDTRCDRRLTLRQLDESFDYCVCNPEACAVYRQLRVELTISAPKSAVCVSVA
jgi:hypothetical protein